jgi:hypothetical protein
MKKRGLPPYTSTIMGRCEELAEKIVKVAHDKESVLGALREIFEASFGEGYARKQFDINYQKEQRELKRKKEWIKERDKIIFKNK